jgi:hypothetical protein
MKDISYICCSKNDDYDKDNLDKLILSLNNNVGQLVDKGMNVETILIDWCSPIPFYTLEKIKTELGYPINHYYIDKSLLVADDLNPERYYEFFAKNVGVRQATGKYVVIENSDILNDEELTDSIIKMVKDNLSNVYGRPTLRYNVWYPNIDEPTHFDTIDDKPLGDLNPGDFMMTTREDWINKAEGYDETNWSHRQKFRQTHMDVEILFQMVKKGMNVHYLKGYYRHMDHDRKGLTAAQQFGDSHRNTNGYTNRKTWGYTNAKIREENGVKILST